MGIFIASSILFSENSFAETEARLMVNEVAVPIVESCSKDSFMVQEIRHYFTENIMVGRTFKENGKIQQDPAKSLIAHQKLEFLY